MIIEAHVQEAELNKLKDSHKILQYTFAAAEQEKDFLRTAIQEGQGGLTQEQRVGLVTYLERLTDENSALANEMKEVMEERDELRKNKEKVERKAQIDVDKALKLYNHTEVAFWDYAVPKVDKLQQELDLKNGKVPPEEQPRPERNPRAADRFALRCAIDMHRGTLRGVNSSRIPSVYYEPGFRPGLISAGLDALRVLRPLGWEAVYNLEKTYLQPLYKPFLEEDAVKYLDEQERQLVQEAAAFGEMHDMHSQLPQSEPVSSSRHTQSRQTTEAPPVPAYESWFARYNDLTREKWEALEDDNKLDYVEIFLRGGPR